MVAIAKTINEEILKGAVVEFASSNVELREGSVGASGELELMGRRHPIAFTLSLDGTGRLTGATTLKQSDWGLKPYSTLFGTLKVADEVQIEIDANLGQGATADG
jgi:polyisoprenoid-binding protein YceI